MGSRSGPGVIAVLHVALPCVVALLAFRQTWQAEHAIFDDMFAVVRNPDIAKTANYTAGLGPPVSLTDVLRHDFWGMVMASRQSHKSYRPLTTLSYMGEVALYNTILASVYGDQLFTADKPPPAALIRQMHGTNALLHALVTGLVTCVAARTLGAWDGMRDRRRSNASGGGTLLSLQLMAGLLFALHPVHVEAVCALVGRAELLSAMFVMLALLTWSDAMHSVGISTLLVCCAMLCKEQGFMGLPLLVAKEVMQRTSILVGVSSAQSQRQRMGQVDEDQQQEVVVTKAKSKRRGRRPDAGASPRVRSTWTSPGDQETVVHKLLRNRQLWLRVTLVAAVAPALLAWRISLNAGPANFAPRANPAASITTPLGTRWRTYAYYAARHLLLLADPRVLCCDWSRSSIALVDSAFDVRNLQSAAFLLPVLVVWPLMCAWQFYHMRTAPPSTAAHHAPFGADASPAPATAPAENATCLQMLFAWCLLVFPFLPASNLLFPVGFTIAERVLYLPSVGWCFAVPVVLLVLVRKARVSGRSEALAALLPLVAIGAVAVLYSMRSVARVEDWQTAERLFGVDVQTNPNNSVLHVNYGKILDNRGATEEARKQYREATRIDEESTAYFHLGVSLRRTGEIEAAVESFEQAIAAEAKDVHFTGTVTQFTVHAHKHLSQLYSHLAKHPPEALADDPAAIKEYRARAAANKERAAKYLGGGRGSSSPGAGSGKRRPPGPGG